MSEIERVARAIYDATVAKARAESAHVAQWENLPKHWRDVHMTSARAAIAAIGGDMLFNIEPPAGSTPKGGNTSD